MQPYISRGNYSRLVLYLQCMQDRLNKNSSYIIKRCYNCENFGLFFEKFSYQRIRIPVLYYLINSRKEE
jgi:hypothetical protein